VCSTMKKAETTVRCKVREDSALHVGCRRGNSTLGRKEEKRKNPGRVPKKCERAKKPLHKYLKSQPPGGSQVKKTKEPRKKTEKNRKKGLMP